MVKNTSSNIAHWRLFFFSWIPHLANLCFFWEKQGVCSCLHNCSCQKMKRVNWTGSTTCTTVGGPSAILVYQGWLLLLLLLFKTLLHLSYQWNQLLPTCPSSHLLQIHSCICLLIFPLLPATHFCNISSSNTHYLIFSLALQDWKRGLLNPPDKP